MYENRPKNLTRSTFPFIPSPNRHQINRPRRKSTFKGQQRDPILNGQITHQPEGQPPSEVLPQPTGEDNKDDGAQGERISLARLAENVDSEGGGRIELEAPNLPKPEDWRVALSEPDAEKMVESLIRMEEEIRKRLELQRSQLEEARHSRDELKEGNERTEAVAYYYYVKAKELVGKKEANLGKIKERSRRGELKIEERISEHERLILEQMNVQSDICREINVALNKRFEEVAERGTGGVHPSGIQMEVVGGPLELQDNPIRDMEVEVREETHSEGEASPSPEDWGSSDEWTLLSISQGSDEEAEEEDEKWD